MNPDGTITQLLTRARTGDKDASDQLFGRVYEDLKRMAGTLLANRDRGRGRLDRTALVSAACERLLGRDKLDARDRRHFFFILKRSMKDVLVEQARADLAAKRGGGLCRVPLDDFIASSDSQSLSAWDIHQALDELAAHDFEAAEVVMLKFFCGCSLDEVGQLTGSTFAVARRNWEYSRAWLHERLVGRRSNPNDS